MYFCLPCTSGLYNSLMSYQESVNWLLVTNVKPLAMWYSSYILEKDPDYILKIKKEIFS